MASLMRSVTIPVLLLCGVFVGPNVYAGTPDELLRGETPVLFTGAEGEDADDTLLLDGQPIRGDEIWLWVPAVDISGDVDLVATGQFFKLWDSGPEAGPNGNDDDDNGMRALDFDPATSTFLLSYEDTTTTGFSFGGILDGDLMELTVVAVDNGAITDFTFAKLFSECTNGDPGCIGAGDINAVMRASDGTLYFGSGSSQTIQTDQAGSLSVGSSTLIHAVLAPDPLNIGTAAYYEPTVLGCPIPFCPGIYTGQVRGFDLLATDEPTFGTSGNYMNQDPSGNDVVEVGQKSDILALPFFQSGTTELEQRTAEVLYDGSLFFQTPDVGDAEILAHDILDNAGEIAALLQLLGPASDAGLALAPFVPSTSATYRRGDVNDDTSINIADAVYLLGNLFPGAGTPNLLVCLDAADTNGDGSINIADAVTLLGSLFGSPTVPLPAPYPDCGTGDSLGCDAYTGC